MRLGTVAAGRYRDDAKEDEARMIADPTYKTPVYGDAYYDRGYNVVMTDKKSINHSDGKVLFTMISIISMS